MANPTITLDGLQQLQQALRAYGGSADDQRAANRAVIDRLIVPAARREAPRRSGRLAETLDSDASAVAGFILAGSRGDVEYAGVVHFGWATRGMGSGLSGNAKERRAALGSALDRSGSTSTRTLTRRATNKAARHSIGTGGRRPVRGGPIAPNPFIYDAIDSRSDEVFAFYEQQLDHRAEIEGLL
jgi:hypothetical protein